MQQAPDARPEPLDLRGVETVADLGRILRQLKRRQAHETGTSEYTIRELAGKLGYSVGVVGAYIQGTALAPADKFDALVQVLGAREGEQRALATVRDLVDEHRREAAASARQRTQFEDGTFPILPRDVAVFTGRCAQLASVLGLPGGGGAAAVPTIVAIDGMAGVGKSAFAIHAAHRLAPRFPDGQLFLSLHAHTPGVRPMQPGEALSILLQSTGVTPRQIPAELQAMQALWRGRLAGKKVLLVLDDAASSDQIQPLLPATSDAMVLVTSRRRLSALGHAVPVSLGVLEPDEGAELLVAAIGRPGLNADDPLVGRVVSQCGALPLAVTLIASRLHHHAAWTLADVSQDLAAASGRLGGLRAENVSVTAAFDLSYRDLSTELQRLFQLLGAIPGIDIDIYCAAALGATTAAVAGEKLNDLADQHLTEEPARGRYRMHDLLREYARTLAAADLADRNLAVKRAIEYYVYAASRANQYIARRTPAERPAPDPPPACPDLHTPRQAFIWMQEEWPNLRMIAEYAQEQGLFDVVGDLASALHGFLRTHGHWQSDLELQNRAVAAARQQADRLVCAASLVALADAQYMLDQYSAALKSLAQAVDLYGERDVSGRADALTVRGNVRRQTGAYQEARQDLEEAVSLYRSADDQNGQANALTYLGDVCMQSGDLADADRALRQALEIFRDLDQTVGQAHALMFLGDVERQSGAYVDAAQTLGQALALFAEHDDRLGQANARVYLGIARYLSGQFQQATESLQDALALQRTLGDRLGIAGALTVLGDVLTQTGRLRAAIDNLTQALALFRDLGHLAGQANTLNYLGHVQRITGDLASAEENLDAALSLFTRLGMPAGLAETHNHLGELMIASDQPDDAFAHHSLALEAARQVESPLDEANALNGIATVCRARQQSADEVDYLRQALAIYDRIGAPAAEQVRHRLEQLQPPPAPS